MDLRAAGNAATLKDQREKALRAVQREKRELLGLRMRQLIDDAELHREREALALRRRDLEEGVASQESESDGPEERANQFTKLLDLAQGGPFVVEHGTSVQLRSLLQELRVEIILRGRRLDFTVSEPLSKLEIAGSGPSWCATWADIWKWIQCGTPRGQSSMRAV